MEVATCSDFFQCSSCLINFEDQELYKKHYSSKFHQYNVKRKLIELPPASLKEYEARFTQFSEQTNNTKQQSYQATKNYCDVCGKSFGNQNTYESHLKSKKHLETLKKKESTSSQDLKSQKSVSEKTSQRTTLNDISICLFCDVKQKSLEANMKHMEINHGFFVVESSYVKNLSGLLKYLAEKINIGLLCIQCENKGTKDFKTGAAVKTHMMDKGHSFMCVNEFEEYAEFYDFTKKPVTKTPVDKKKKDSEKQKTTLKEEDVDVEEVKQQQCDVDDGEWEDESEENEEEEEENKVEEVSSEEDESEEDSDEEDNGLTKKERAEKKERRRLFRKSYKKLNRSRFAKYKVNHLGELELDNGKILGHRQYKQQYNMYYRFRADPFRNLQSILGGPEMSKNRQIMIAKKMNQIAIHQKHMRQLAYKNEEKHIARDRFRMKQIELKTGMRNNRTMMMHYVNQNPL